MDRYAIRGCVSLVIGFGASFWFGAFDGLGFGVFVAVALALVYFVMATVKAESRKVERKMARDFLEKRRGAAE